MDDETLAARLLCAGGGGNAATACLFEAYAFKYCLLCSASWFSLRSASYLCLSFSKGTGIEFGGRCEVLAVLPPIGFLAVEDNC